MTDRIVKFVEPQELPGSNPPPGWTVREGTPQTRTSVQYMSDDKGFFSGFWECTTGAFDVVYDKWEFCHVISGSCIVTPTGGDPVTLKTGDSFVIEKGFTGTWQVVETMKKHFVFRA